MTIGDHSMAGPAVDNKVSALVVGIEKYRTTGHSRYLEGAARSSMDFTNWLIDRAGFPPERITLMVAYDEETPDPAQSNRLTLEDLRKRQVNLIEDTGISEGFERWARDHPPAPDDTLFVLFWIGHGCAYPNDPTGRVCLLGPDATNDVLHHVDLDDLLHAAGTYAPDAERVAFVDACRGIVHRAWDRPLENGYHRVPKKIGGSGEPNGPLSVVYAAAHGETTRDAHWQDRGFAEELLEQLSDQGKMIRNPVALFGDELEKLVESLAAGQNAVPFWVQYGYRYRRKATNIPPPPEDICLTPLEWDRLQREAARIDRGTHSASAWHWLWSAYCFALGPAPRETSRPLPDRLTSVSDLVTALRDLPARGNAPSTVSAPPLVVACDFIAHLSDARGRSRLARWCDEWAANRDDRAASHCDRARQLSDVQKQRPARLPSQSYLSIVVINVAEANGTDRYSIKAVLWAVGRPKLLGVSGQANLTEDGIFGAVKDLLDQVFRDDDLSTKQNEMILEFVLPKNLLGWVGRGEQQSLGFRYPVVIRDRDRKSDVRHQDKNTWRGIDGFSASRRLLWSDRIRWFTCGPPWPTRATIEATTANSERWFGIGLALPSRLRSGDGDDWGLPPGLTDAINAGAAIVVWIRQENYTCDGRHYWLRRRIGNGAAGCFVPHVQKLIAKGLDRRKTQGLRDLPQLLREIRVQMHEKVGSVSPPEIGVLMEDPMRFWPGYFGLQAEPVAAGNSSPAEMRG